MQNRDSNIARRIWLKAIASAAMAVPFGMLASQANATQNAGLRSALKYQDTPNAGKQCSACLQFVPGKTAKDKGGCKVMPGDTEISPTGYCTAWVEAKK